MYFRLLADELNGAGWSMQKTLKETVDIEWTPENIKKYLWKPIQEALLEKDSTRELTTDEVSKVYDILHRHLSEKTGVGVAFPEDPNIHNYETHTS